MLCNENKKKLHAEFDVTALDLPFLNGVPIEVTINYLQTCHCHTIRLDNSALKICKDRIFHI